MHSRSSRFHVCITLLRGQTAGVSSGVTIVIRLSYRLPTASRRLVAMSLQLREGNCALSVPSKRSCSSWLYTVESQSPVGWVGSSGLVR
jgi:hypothetical protein